MLEPYSCAKTSSGKVEERTISDSNAIGVLRRQRWNREGDRGLDHVRSQAGGFVGGLQKGEDMDPKGRYSSDGSLLPPDTTILVAFLQIQNRLWGGLGRRDLNERYECCQSERRSREDNMVDDASEEIKRGVHNQNTISTPRVKLAWLGLWGIKI
ncbi:hypothetical protein B0H19DRAFT_1072065 [Mycena capillaripes]|nr:hypothetical protein B0H19DRAFT_1072065 [Mycena capillaripes]